MASFTDRIIQQCVVSFENAMENSENMDKLKNTVVDPLVDHLKLKVKLFFIIILILLCLILIVNLLIVAFYIIQNQNFKHLLDHLTKLTP